MATTQRSTIEVFDGTCCVPLSSNLSEEQAVDLAKVFAALADPVRLKQMGEAMKSLARPTAAEDIAKELLRLAS